MQNARAEVARACAMHVDVLERLSWEIDWNNHENRGIARCGASKAHARDHGRVRLSCADLRGRRRAQLNLSRGRVESGDRPVTEGLAPLNLNRDGSCSACDICDIRSCHDLNLDHIDRNVRAFVDFSDPYCILFS